MNLFATLVKLWKRRCDVSGEQLFGITKEFKRIEEELKIIQNEKHPA